MGGVWGLTTGKFVLVASGVLMSASINRVPARVLIDSALDTSVVDRRFVASHHLRVSNRDTGGSLLRSRTAIGVAGRLLELPPLRISDQPLPDGADAVLARDALSHDPIGFDLRRRFVFLLDHREVPRRVRGFAPYGVTVGPTGITIENAAAPSAAKTLTFGTGTASHDVPGDAAAAGIGLSAFGCRTVISDLGDGRMFVGPEQVGRHGRSTCPSTDHASLG
jgi:hypothetical protein